MNDQPGVKARRRDVFEMTSTGRLCHPVGFDGDEPRSRLLGRSIAPVLTGKLIQIQNSRPSITPTSNCSGNCRVSNIRRNSTLRSSFASRACIKRKEEFLALSGCFSTISHSPYLRLVSAQHLAPKARRYGPRWKMCKQQVSDSLRSNLRNERDIFDGRYFSEIPTQVGPGCLQSTRTDTRRRLSPVHRIVFQVSFSRSIKRIGNPDGTMGPGRYPPGRVVKQGDS